MSMPKFSLFHFTPLCKTLVHKIPWVIRSLVLKLNLRSSQTSHCSLESYQSFLNRLCLTPVNRHLSLGLRQPLILYLSLRTTMHFLELHLNEIIQIWMESCCEIFEYVFSGINCFVFCKYFRSRTAGSHGRRCITLWETAKLFCKSSC